MSDSGTDPTVDRSNPTGLEARIRDWAKVSEVFMDLLEFITAIITISLFIIGVFDLGLKIYDLMITGRFTQPNEVVKVIDTALLLLIIVEIYRTIIAYVEDLNILPIVLNVALIAMARKIISFRAGKYETANQALTTAGSYGALMLILVIAFYLTHKVQEETEFNIYTQPDNEEP